MGLTRCALGLGLGRGGAPGALFLTTQTDIGFLAAAAGGWTRGIKAALEGEPDAAR